MAKRKTHHKRKVHKKSKTQSKKNMNMKGGFSPVQRGWLQSFGLDQEQINEIAMSGIEFVDLVDIINNISREYEDGNSDEFAELIMREVNNGRMDISNILHDEDDIHDIDRSHGSLHLSDLSVGSRSEGSTTIASEDLSLFDTDIDTDVDTESDDEMEEATLMDDELNGGKKKRKASHKKSAKRQSKKMHKKSRKNKRLRGGMCFGNGVGANKYDPNYSIYNTNMLKLFPYKA